MKPECSLEPGEEQEPIWLPLNRIEEGRMGNLSVVPSKAVLSLIQAIEQGHFPIVFLNELTSIPLTESNKAYEAYVRCHISIIPILYKEVEEKDVPSSYI